MRNRLFVPDFLFDFYTNRGSIGTPSAISHVTRVGLGKYRAKRTKWRFSQILIAFYRKSRKARETIFGSLVAGLVLY